MSDAALLFTVACGFTAATYYLALGALHEPADRPLLLKITGLAACIVFVPFLFDLAYAFLSFDGEPFRFRTEVGIGAVFVFIYVFPFYGFVSTRIFPIINEQTVLTVLLLLGYTFYETYFDSSAFLWAVLFLCVGAALLVSVTFGYRPVALRIALYGWYLSALLVLSVLQLPAIADLFVSANPGGVFVVLFAAMATVFLVFHIWFALKYFFITASCIRRRGRELAVPFFERKFSALRIPAAVLAIIAIAQIVTYGLNASYDLIPPGLLIQATVALVPGLVDVWITRSKQNV